MVKVSVGMKFEFISILWETETITAQEQISDIKYISFWIK